MTQHVVIGAGIIGLYTTFELIERGVDPATILIIAEFFPGDQSIKYASPYAGAYFTPFVDTVSYCRYTYESFDLLRKFIGGDATGIEKVTTKEHFSEHLDNADIADIIKFIPDLEISDSSVAGCQSQVTFTGIVFNPPLLTFNLLSRFKELGVKTVTKQLKSLDEAFGEDTVAVFNCSGLGAANLCADKTVFPTRGQVVVVRDPSVKSVVTAWRETSSTYIIPRPFSNTHEVILGGFYQPNVSTPHTFSNETEDIINRTTELLPDLLKDKTRKDLEILRVIAGARPSREGGARIEKESTSRGTVFHNYGAGGSGFINGLGMAHACVELFYPDIDLVFRNV